MRSTHCRLGKAPAKLRAFPIGAHRRGDFAPALEAAEAETGASATTRREDLLMCCCMAALPPPGAPEAEYPGLTRPASFHNMKPANFEALTNASVVLGPLEAFEAVQKSMHASVGQTMKRVRRTAVVDALKASGFTTCSYGPHSNTHEGAGHATYVQRMRRASFVASPQGNGRARGRGTGRTRRPFDSTLERSLA